MMDNEKLSIKQKLILLIRDIKRIYRTFLSIIGDIIYRFPLNDVKVIAVTGTSGKSTTTAMIYEMLNYLGFKVGMISTVEAKINGFSIDTGFHVTTPNPIHLKKIARIFKDKGMQILVLESSSHSLDQGRLGLIKIKYAVYTNIQRDHLDYHFTWQKYAEAKSRLIKKSTKDSYVILNKDDMSYKFLNKVCHEKKMNNVIAYSLSEIQDLKCTLDGLDFSYKNINFKIPILGDYNIYNVLAAIKTGESMGISINKIRNALAQFKGLTGRMQVIKTHPFSIIVDFAHNTDSLEKALKFVKSFYNNKIISIFGSAGLRDIEKRFTMGKASGELADITIITAEDPRTESLKDINTRIIEGCKAGGAKLIYRFKDHQDFMENHEQFLNYESYKLPIVFSFDEESTNSRYDAILFGIKIAKKGDLVITFGKGHEKSLCFGTIEYPFTDQEAVEKALKLLGN